MLGDFPSFNDPADPTTGGPDLVDRLKEKITGHVTCASLHVVRTSATYPRKIGVYAGHAGVPSRNGYAERNLNVGIFYNGHVKSFLRCELPK